MGKHPPSSSQCPPEATPDVAPGADSSGGTAQRLFAAAAQIFAQKGYEHATVREICQLAQANVAAVNYHFGDKEGLYRSLLEQAYRDQAPKVDMTTPGVAPQDRLTGFVRAMLEALLSQERPAWGDVLLYREMAQPSTLLPDVVARFIKPRCRAVRATVAQLLDLDPEKPSPLVDRCTLSIISQCLHYHYSRHVVAVLYPSLPCGPQAVDEIAQHIMAFSLGGIKALSGEL